MKTLNLANKILRPIAADVCPPASSGTCLEILTAVFSTKKYDGCPIDMIRRSQKKMRGERVSRIVWVKTDLPAGMDVCVHSGQGTRDTQKMTHQNLPDVLVQQTGAITNQIQTKHKQ